MPDEEAFTISVGCESEFVECADCSFVAIQITIDGAPSGELCIVPVEDLD
jgi:transcriptional regulator of heat shock response